MEHGTLPNLTWTIQGRDYKTDPTAAMIKRRVQKVNMTREALVQWLDDLNILASEDAIDWIMNGETPPCRRY